MLADLGTEFHFFDLDDVVLAASIFLFLDAFEFEFAVVHDPSHWWLRLGRDFHQVHLPFHRQGFGAVDGQDTQLLVAIVNDADFSGADLVVDAKFPKCRGSSLLRT
jgi:hypothetical protein